MEFRHEETSDGPVLHSAERDFQVLLGPCPIARSFDKVIRVNVGTFYDVTTGNQCPIPVQFSEAGLLSLLEDLRSAPMPFTPPSQAEKLDMTPWMWWVQFQSGEIIQQYPPEGGLLDWSAIQGRSGEIHQIWVVPRDPGDVGKLPGFGFLGQGGFVRSAFPGAPLERLLVPAPPEGAPFHWHYYRRNFHTNGVDASGGQHPIDNRVIQVIGWKVDRGDQEPLICEIGVEQAQADVIWNVWRKLPVGDPFWEIPILAPEPKRIIATHGVHVVEMAEQPER